jgi:hypothetical protein
VSIPRKYPFDGLVLGISEEGDGLLLSMQTKAGGNIFHKEVSHAEVMVMCLFAACARLAISDGLGIELPLHLGQIIAQEWGIALEPFPSYLMRGSMLLPMEVA